MCEETSKDLELLEFSESPGLTQDIPHNACSFNFLVLVFTEEIFQTLENKIKEYADNIIDTMII